MIFPQIKRLVLELVQANFIPMTALVIISAILVAFLILLYIDWRKDERENPETRYKGSAPLRYLKHVGGRIADAILLNLPF